MSLIKLCIETELFQDPKKDPRMLVATERRKPQMRIKPNKAIIDFGMKK